MNIKQVRLGSIIIVSMLCMALSITDKSWKEAKRKNGFVIYTKQVAGYETKMFKLDATFENVKIAKIAGIIRDADKTEDWISDVIEGELISKTSDDKWLSYLLFDLPWPLDQREMALDHDITTNTPEEVFIKLTVNNKTPQKEEGAIRITNAEGYWKLNQVGADVKIIYCFVGDPNGSVPNWVIDMFIVDGPLGTITKLRELCKVE